MTCYVVIEETSTDVFHLKGVFDDYDRIPFDKISDCIVLEVYLNELNDKVI